MNISKHMEKENQKNVYEKTTMPNIDKQYMNVKLDNVVDKIKKDDAKFSKCIDDNCKHQKLIDMASSKIMRFKPFPMGDAFKELEVVGEYPDYNQEIEFDKIFLSSYLSRKVDANDTIDQLKDIFPDIDITINKDVCFATMKSDNRKQLDKINKIVNKMKKKRMAEEQMTKLVKDTFSPTSFVDFSKSIDNISNPTDKDIIDKDIIDKIKDADKNNKNTTLFAPQVNLKDKTLRPHIKDKNYKYVITKDQDKIINKDMRPESETVYSIDYEYLKEFIDTYDTDCLTISRINNLIELLNENMINDDYRNKLLKLRDETLTYFKNINTTSFVLYPVVDILNKLIITQTPDDITNDDINNTCKEFFKQTFDETKTPDMNNTKMNKKKTTLEEFSNNQEQFFDKLHNLCKKKQTEYTRDESPFHNFEKAKGLSFHNTKSKVAWEYMVKHLQSVKDLLNDNEVGNDIKPEVIDEKIGDIIIYMTLIRSMLREDN